MATLPPSMQPASCCASDRSCFSTSPPADVKAQVLSSFAQVGWDVRIRQPLKGSHPPNGQQLTSLAFGLCCYFSHRNGIQLPPPEAGIVTVPAAAPRPAPQPQQHHHHGGKGGREVQSRDGGHRHRGKGGKGGGGIAIPNSRGSNYAGGGGQQNANVHQPRQRGNYQHAGAQQGGKGGRRNNNRGHQ